MHWLSRVARSALLTARHFDPRGLPLAVGRSLMAGAMLSELVFTPNGGLFDNVAGLSGGASCDGIRSISVWCLSQELTHGFLLGDIIAIGVLVLVVSGYRPRWTCIPHWYVTFGFAVSMTVPNGGDSIAKIATLLLVPLCLGDRRTWQWQDPVVPLAPTWRGITYATTLVARLQVCIIYLSVAVAKLTDYAWSHGTAMYYIFNHPAYGLPSDVRPMLPAFFYSAWFNATLTWSVVALQLVVAITVLGPRSMRLVAFALGVALHAAIIMVMGLPSFGLVMISLVTIAALGPSPQKSLPSRESDQIADRDVVGGPVLENANGWQMR